MLIKPFKAVYPKFNLIESPDQFTDNTKNDYIKYKKEGLYMQAKKEAIYLYKIKTIYTSYIGLIAVNDIIDLDQNRILKHEKTLIPKVEEMAAFLKKNQAMVKPVLLTHPEIPGFNEYLNSLMDLYDPILVIQFKKNNETHTFWEVNQKKDLQYLVNTYAKDVQNCYIADGHHRSETVWSLYHKNFFNETGFNGLLCAYFGFNQLSIYEYNRIITMPDKITKETFLSYLSKNYIVQPLEKYNKPSKDTEITLVFFDCFYNLIDKSANSALQTLQNLEKQILKEILGISDIRNSNVIEYIEGVSTFEGMAFKLKNDHRKVLFSMPPLSIGDVTSIADLHQTLPPKSTWFEPRMKSGIIIKEF